jgi:cell division transport system ATP-binding protein
MIRFEHVSKRYGSCPATLTDLSFEIASGVLAIVCGRSGAGKSTLLNLIAAIERPSSGRVVVNGEDVGALRTHALPYLRRRLGLVFQDHKILYDRNVYDNVALPLYITSHPLASIPARVRAALDKVGLLDRERAMPHALSGGEQQRLCIARAIVHRPAILLADEPTGNLDAEYAAHIAELFLSFNQVGVTVLIATHDQTVIERLRARRLTLDQGRLGGPTCKKGQ